MKSYIIFLVLCLHCSYMKADFNNFKENGYYLKFQNAGSLTSDLEKCFIILDDFVEFASNFTKCTIKYARPLSTCSKCIDAYSNSLEKYKEMLDSVVNGTSCKSVFIANDRYQAVLEYYNSIVAIWNKGHCNECFDWSQGKHELSNITRNFNSMFQDAHECIIQNHNPAANDSKEVCTKCMLSYDQLNKYYNALTKNSVVIDNVCMDIVDAMGGIRSLWSKVLDCCDLRKSPEIVFLCCTAIIGVLPLFFYLVLRFYGPIRDLPNVLKQSRFKQMLLRSSDRTIN